MNCEFASNYQILCLYFTIQNYVNYLILAKMNISETYSVQEYHPVLMTYNVSSKKSFKASNLHTQLPYESNILILIDGGFVDDVLSTVGISQGTKCLSIVTLGWGESWGKFKEI